MTVRKLKAVNCGCDGATDFGCMNCWSHDELRFAYSEARKMLENCNPGIRLQYNFPEVKIAGTRYILISVHEELETEIKRLKDAYSKMNESICQTLGKVMGYPWLKDDQKNFPGATSADGICQGDNVAESMADEAADLIARLKSDVAYAGGRLCIEQAKTKELEEEIKALGAVS